MKLPNLSDFLTIGPAPDLNLRFWLGPIKIKIIPSHPNNPDEMIIKMTGRSLALDTSYSDFFTRILVVQDRFKIRIESTGEWFEADVTLLHVSSIAAGTADEAVTIKLELDGKRLGVDIGQKPPAQSPLYYLYVRTGADA